MKYATKLWYGSSVNASAAAVFCCIYTISPFLSEIVVIITTFIIRMQNVRRKKPYVYEKSGNSTHGVT